jgi:hypothetical protein
MKLDLSILEGSRRLGAAAAAREAGLGAPGTLDAAAGVGLGLAQQQFPLPAVKDVS